MFLHRSRMSMSNSKISKSDLRDALKEFFGAEDKPQAEHFKWEEIVACRYGDIDNCQRFITYDEHYNYSRPLGFPGRIINPEWRVKSGKDILPDSEMIYVPYSESRQKVLNDARTAMISEFCQ